MRPGQITPNELEVALLERLNAERPDFRVDIPRLQVLRRTYTCVGSYTDFVPNERPYTLERQVVPMDVVVTLPTAKNGLGVIFFLEGPKLTLELCSYDGRWDGVYEGFSVRRVIYDVVLGKGKFGGRIEGVD
jgi:hypothetical protein